MWAENLKAGDLSDTTRRPHSLVDAPPWRWPMHMAVLLLRSDSQLDATGTCLLNPGQQHPREKARVKCTHTPPPQASSPETQWQGAALLAGHGRPSPPPMLLLCPAQISRWFTPSHRVVNFRYQSILWLSFSMLHPRGWVF